MRRRSGSVVEQPWGQTLAELARDGVTGVLTIDADRTYTITFDLGAIVAAMSPLPSDSVARVALTSHLISSTHVPDITKRLAAAPDRDELEILAEAARLSAEQVDLLRKKLVAQRAARTFALEDGTYRVDERIAVPPGTQLDVRAIIYQGARATISEARMAEVLRTFGGELRLKPDAVTTLDAYGFDPKTQPVVDALRAGTSVPALEAQHRDLDPRTIHAAVYALVVTDACDVQQRTPFAPAPPRRAGTPSYQPPVRRDLAADTSYSVSRPASANEPAIITDSPSARDFASLPTPGRAPTGNLVTPRQPAVPRTLTPPAVSRTTTPIGHVAISRTKTEPPQGRTPTSPAVARTSTARRTQALIAARTILLEQGASYFELLGVPFDAPNDVVQTAYLNLVRQLHPDKLTELGLAEVPNAQRLFSQVSTAFATLTDPARRAAYLERLAGGTVEPPRAASDSGGFAASRTKTDDGPTTPAGEAYRRGESALRRDDPETAVIELARAVQLEPMNVDYQAMLGWAQFCAASDKPTAAIETRRALDRALQKSPRPAAVLRARLLLGRVERMLGRDREALRHFQLVIDEAPTHAEAASEIRAIEARLAAGTKKR